MNNTDKVLAFHRWGAGPNDQVMVVMNFSNKPLTNYSIGGFPADGVKWRNSDAPCGATAPSQRLAIWQSAGIVAVRLSNDPQVE